MPTHVYCQPLHTQNIMKHMYCITAWYIELYLYVETVAFKIWCYLCWGQNTCKCTILFVVALSQSIFDISFITFFTGYLWEIFVLLSLYLLKEAGKKTNRLLINKISDGFVYIMHFRNNQHNRVYMHFVVKSAEIVLHTQEAWFNLAEFEFGIEYTALAGMT